MLFPLFFSQKEVCLAHEGIKEPFDLGSGHSAALLSSTREGSFSASEACLVALNDVEADLKTFRKADLHHRHGWDCTPREFPGSWNATAGPPAGRTTEVVYVDE